VLQKTDEEWDDPGAKQGSKNPLLRGVGGVSSRRTIIWYDPSLKELARQLRNNSTISEIILWKQLKGRFAGKYDFHRQKPLDHYIADFFCYELRLVIEVDGKSHDHPETGSRDVEKERRLNQLGLNVLRFTDSDVLWHLDSTIDVIRRYMEAFEKKDFSIYQSLGNKLNVFTGEIM